VSNICCAFKEIKKVGKTKKGVDAITKTVESVCNHLHFILRDRTQLLGVLHSILYPEPYLITFSNFDAK